MKDERGSKKRTRFLESVVVMEVKKKIEKSIFGFLLKHKIDAK